MLNWDPHPTVLWELTRLCDQRCRGCPTGASEQLDPNELTTYEAYKTIDQIAALRPRELIISGGDPLQRDDVYQVIDYARRRGLDPSLVLMPTRELTFDTIAKLESNGLTRVIFGADTPAVQWQWAQILGLRIEVNTLVLRGNAGDLESIVERMRPFNITRWNVHFLVPIGASRELQMLTAEEAERVFETLEKIRTREQFALRVVEAPHYRRFRLQRLLLSRLTGNWSDFTGYVPDDENGARGFVYISHAGDVRPSEFVPHSAGNLRYRDLGTIYRGSDLFVALRDPDNLHGKCRQCEFRVLCGGSRARAYAMTGDLFGTDPLCAWKEAST